MNEKEYRAAKARIAYEAFVEQLPKCDLCENCVFLNGRNGAKRACLPRKELIDGNVKYSPLWCPKRK